MTRRTRILGLAALGLLVAGSARALPEGWYTLGPGVPYKCHGNHVAGGVGRVIRVVIFEGAIDIRRCQELCDRTEGCVAFSFQRRVSEKGSVATACVLLNRYDVDAVPITDRGPFDWGAVCYRHHSVQDDLSREWRDRLELHQDQLRPGLRPSTPSSPNP